MFSISDSIRLLVERYDKGKHDGNQYEILKHAILAEAKTNNDLATIICRIGAKNIAKEAPKLFDQFSIGTSGVLLSIGLPAYVIFGDKNNPDEEKLKELNQLSYKKLQKKTSAELYEFYIRKCNLIKSLYAADSLELERISLHRRCKNIEHATLILISRLR